MSTFAIRALPYTVLLVGCAATFMPASTAYFASEERVAPSASLTSEESFGAGPRASSAVTRGERQKVDARFAETSLAFRVEAGRWLGSKEGLVGLEPALGALADALDAVPVRAGHAGRELTARWAAEVREHAEILYFAGEIEARQEIKSALLAAAEAIASEEIFGGYGTNPEVTERVVELRRQVSAIPMEGAALDVHVNVSNALFAAVDAIHSLEATPATTSVSAAPPPTADFEVTCGLGGHHRGDP